MSSSLSTSSAGGEESAILLFGKYARLVLGAHSELQLFYKQLESIHEVYSKVYQLLNYLADQELAIDAFGFYARNHFSCLLFMADRVNELFNKGSDCAAWKGELVLSLGRDKKFQKPMIELSFSAVKAILVLSDCREWRICIRNMFGSIFEDARIGKVKVPWKVYSLVHKQEKIEFGWPFDKTKSTVLDRHNCPLEVSIISSHIANMFIPEFMGSNLISRAMSGIIETSVANSRSFGRNQNSWALLESAHLTKFIPSPATTSSSSGSTPQLLAKRKRTPDDDSSQTQKKPVRRIRIEEDDDEISTADIFGVMGGSGGKSPQLQLTDSSSSSSSTAALPAVSSTISSVNSPPEAHFKSLSVTSDHFVVPTVRVKARSPVDASTVSSCVQVGGTLALPTVACWNWAASASEDIDSSVESSSVDLFGEDSESDAVIIDLTGTDSDSACDAFRAASPPPTGPSLERSPSRRGDAASDEDSDIGRGDPFDDSTLEMDFDSESSGSSTPPTEQPFVPPERLICSAEAELRYEGLVHNVGRDLLMQLCNSSRRTQNLADDLSCVPSVSIEPNQRAANKDANERTKLYLTEAIMMAHTATTELIALQSHLLLAASLKDQGFNPLCNEFSSRDKHFNVSFPVYENYFRAGGAQNNCVLVKRIV
jgi:hypothetical protein